MIKYTIIHGSTETPINTGFWDFAEMFKNIYIH